MIQLLFTLLAAEVAMVVVLLFKTPFRKLAILGLDRLKRGRGPVTVKTVAATMLVVLSSSVYSMAKIRNRSEEIGALTPTDQVLMSRHLLEASLMAGLLCKILRDPIPHQQECVNAISRYSLFLALIIDRLHHYIRELRSLRKSMDAVMKQDRSVEEAKMENSEEIKARDKQIALLTEEIEHLKVESETKVKDAKAAESNAMALKKQSEGFLLEYDRLLEENQSLRSQMQSNDSKKFI